MLSTISRQLLAKAQGSTNVAKLAAAASTTTAAPQKPQMRVVHQMKQQPTLPQAAVNAIVYKPLTDSDKKSVVQLFTEANAQRENPLYATLDAPMHEMVPWIEEKLGRLIDQGSSFIAVDEVNGEVIGVILNEKTMRGRITWTKKHSDQMELAEKLRFAVSADEFVNLPSPANSILKIHDVVIAKSYRNSGIGSKLMDLTMKEAIQERCCFVTATATTKALREMLAKKNGFQNAPLKDATVGFPFQSTSPAYLDWFYMFKAVPKV